MPDIEYEFPIRGSLARVFTGVSTPAGLDQWWTLRSAGKPAAGGIYALDFGPGHFWRARVEACDAPTLFVLEFTEALPDWVGTRVQFHLSPIDAKRTTVRFTHAGWRDESQHYRVSAFCWAMYLRILRRHIESGDVVPYDKRLDV